MNRSSKYKLRKLLPTFQDFKFLKDNSLDKRLIMLYSCYIYILQYWLRHEKINFNHNKQFLLGAMKTTLQRTVLQQKLK